MNPMSAYFVEIGDFFIKILIIKVFLLKMEHTVPNRTISLIQLKIRMVQSKIINFTGIMGIVDRDGSGFIFPVSLCKILPGGESNERY